MAGQTTMPRMTTKKRDGRGDNIVRFQRSRRRPRNAGKIGIRGRVLITGVVGKVGGVVAILLIALAILNPIKRYPEHIPWLVEATSVRTVSGPVTHVRDGDTIEVKGLPVRFSSLDCAEMNTSEGREAKVGMQVLVSGHNVSCHLSGGRSYDRWIASCFRDDGLELASAMIRAGFCQRYW